MRIPSHSQRFGGPQRALSPADQALATRLAKEMALFSKLQGGAAPVPVRVSLAPGMPAFSAAAKRDYAELIALHGAPRLPASFVVKQLPPVVQRAVDTFNGLHGGAAEVALNAIDGHRTYQAQLPQRGQAQVLLLDARGQELARGVARGAAVSWRW